MSKKKIFNDPVYGLISFPYEILYDLIDHPYFQRLRRISQVGLTYLVYPGAHHTRFHHALGACHLMTRAIGTLREKDIEITEEEAKVIEFYLGDLMEQYGYTLEFTNKQAAKAASNFYEWSNYQYFYFDRFLNEEL